ncbi:DnaJ domain-containing protein [Pedobacter sp.]|nr:DnaJ domain-containing protein [Candidatus Saccharibacteria bacterium]
MTELSCYTILRIAENASVDEIKRAFRARAKQLHPDHGGDAKEFADLKKAFEQAIAAYSKHAPMQAQQPKSSVSQTGYDPFTDLEYDRYIFFEPNEDKIADFERSIYSRHCVHCNGRGKISKLVYPEKGFLGREERFCICQKIGIRQA